MKKILLIIAVLVLALSWIGCSHPTGGNDNSTVTTENNGTVSGNGPENSGENNSGGNGGEETPEPELCYEIDCSLNEYSDDEWWTFYLNGEVMEIGNPKHPIRLNPIESFTHNGESVRHGLTGYLPIDEERKYAVNFILSIVGNQLHVEIPEYDRNRNRLYQLINVQKIETNIYIEVEFVN